jgi:hypothetical protein
VDSEYNDLISTDSSGVFVHKFNKLDSRKVPKILYGLYAYIAAVIERKPELLDGSLAHFMLSSLGFNDPSEGLYMVYVIVLAH